VRFWDASASVAEAFLAGYEEIRPLAVWERAALPVLQAARHIHGLGTPAMYVDLWGSAYLSDRMIDVLIGAIRQCMDAVDAVEDDRSTDEEGNRQSREPN
jgi:Ser/Thr protein kinase RdoA (MazF antagonist)